MEVKPDGDAVCRFETQISKDVSGSYRAVVTDKRGEDVSTLQLLGGGEADICDRKCVCVSVYVCEQ